MTQGTDIPSLAAEFLPPVAWMRAGGWGQDVSAIVRNEPERVQNDHLVSFFINYLSYDEITAIVALRRYERVLGPIGTTSISRIKSLTDDEHRRISTGRSHEILMANLAMHLVSSGMRIHHFDAETTTLLLADSAEPLIADLPPLEHAIYATFADADAQTMPGERLDGFYVVPTRMVDVEDAPPEQKDSLFFIVPASRSNASVNESRTDQMVIWVGGEAGDTLEQAIVRSARLGREASEERISDMDAEADQTDVAGEDASPSTGDDACADGDATEPVDAEPPSKGQGGLLRAVANSDWTADSIRRDQAVQGVAFGRHAEASASAWSRLVAGALVAAACDQDARPGYPEEAPAQDVVKALSASAGSRKAHQRLVAAGYPRMILHSDVVPERRVATDPASPGVSVPSAVETADPAVDAKPACAPDGAGRQPRKPSRKDRRLLRKAESAARIATVAEGDDEAGEEAAEPTLDKTPDPSPEPTHGAEDIGRILVDAFPVAEPHPVPAHDPVNAAIVDDVTRRSFRDLPALSSRNWQATLPTALAPLIMRRLHVAQEDRESHETTRRRLAAAIRPRLDGLDALSARLSAEIARHPRERRSFRIGRASIERDVDADIIASPLAHVVDVIVDDDPDLTRMILFPGVGTETTVDDDERSTTVVRAWAENGMLHLLGLVHRKAMAGFRRVEVDLATGEVEDFDGEQDRETAEQVRDALYAPVADALLGPVEEWDAWRHHRRPAGQPSARERAGRQTPIRDADDRKANAAVPAEVVPLDWGDQDFASVADMTAAGTPGAAATTAIEAMGARNALLRAIARSALEDPRPEASAILRHLASAGADAHSRIDAIASPELADEVDLTGSDDVDGAAIVTDRALFEAASGGGGSVVPLRERPIALLYRLRADGLAAAVAQIAPDGTLNLARALRMPLVSSEQEDDLDWHVRGVVHRILAGEERHADAVGDATRLPAVTTAPLLRADGRRQGTKRTIAQARIHPASLSAAIEAAGRWFDAQRSRHGGNLLVDRRDEGEWVTENRGADRGIVSRWSVTMRLAPGDPVGLDIIVGTTLASGAKARLPGLIREIAAATPTRGPDGPLEVPPPYVCVRAQVAELIRHLQSPDRRLPTLVLSQTADGRYAVDPDDVARQSLGALNVVLLADRATRDLSDALGQQYRVFGGAARLFQPKFDPDGDAPSRHPRILRDGNASRLIDDIVTRASAATITRYDISDAPLPETPPVATDGADEASEPLLPFEAATSDETMAPRAEADARPSPPVAAPAASGNPADDDAATTPPATPVVEPAIDGVRPPLGDETPRAHDEAGNLRGDEGPVTTSPASPPERHAQPPMAPAPKAPAPLAPKPVPPVPAAMPAPIGAMVDPDVLAGMVAQAVGKGFADLGVATAMASMTSLLQRLETHPSLSVEAVETGRLQAELAAARAAIQTHDENLRIERETMTELLTEAEGERSDAVEQVHRLREEINRIRRAAHAPARQEWPSELSELGDWLEGNVLPNVVITNKAWRTIRKVRYTDMERLCRTLQLIDGAYVDMRSGLDGARERWLEGLKELRLEIKKNTQMGNSVRGGAEYSFQHDKRQYQMTHHLRGVESLFNETSRLLRIYFTYDDEQGRVLIGHLPTHLQTVDS